MPLRKASTDSFTGNSLFIFLARFFPSLANLLVMILYSKYLPTHDYGMYQHFWIDLFFLYPLACFGIHVLVVTYSGAMLKTMMRHLATKHYIIYVLWVLVLAGIFAAMQVYALDVSFIIPFIFFVCYALSLILEAILIVFRKMYSVVRINVVYSVAFVVAHWLVLKDHQSLQMLFIYLLILTAARFLAYLPRVAGTLKQAVPADENSYDVAKVRSLWMHLGIYDVVQIVSTYADKFVISIVLTTELSAIYYNGSQNIPFLPLLLGAVATAVLMRQSSHGGDESKAGMVQLMNHSGRLLSCIVFPVFFFLVFYRYEFITTVFTKKYAGAAPVFLAAILVLPVRSYSFTTILQKLHKGSIINKGAIGELLLACAMMYPLYRVMGLPGVALSFVITTYLQATYYLYHSARLLGASPLQLIPYGNWLIKFIVFLSLFIGLHYITTSYFTGNIPLILGGIVMVLAIAVSLGIEIKKNKDVHTA